MSDAGFNFDVNNLSLKFVQSAPEMLPDNSQIISGSYLPTDYVGGDVFPFPAPVANTQTLSAFNGTIPNGVWSLYIVDDSSQDSGSLNVGWSLLMEFGVTRPVLSSPVMLNSGQFQFTLNGEAGFQHVIQASKDLQDWVPVSTNLVNGPTLILFEQDIANPVYFFRAFRPE